MTKTRILVCGGRDYSDAEWFDKCIMHLIQHVTPADILIIQGGARGADRLAKEWAERYGVEQIEFRADWDRHGKAAGYIRNKQMLDEGKPHMVVAFPGGRGTASMVQIAHRANLAVWQPGDRP